MPSVSLTKCLVAKAKPDDVTSSHSTLAVTQGRKILSGIPASHLDSNNVLPQLSIPHSLLYSPSRTWHCHTRIHTQGEFKVATHSLSCFYSRSVHLLCPHTHHLTHWKLFNLLLPGHELASRPSWNLQASVHYWLRSQIQVEKSSKGCWHKQIKWLSNK